MAGQSEKGKSGFTVSESLRGRHIVIPHLLQAPALPRKSRARARAGALPKNPLVSGEDPAAWISGEAGRPT